jgi:hypothetical protein
MNYTTSTGWVINPRKLKTDDRLFLQTLKHSGQLAQQNFIDECVELYLRAWKIDLIDYNKSVTQ